MTAYLVRSAEMHGQNVIPLLFCHGDEALVPQNASICDEYVNATKCIHSLFDESITILCGADGSDGTATSYI